MTGAKTQQNHLLPKFRFHFNSGLMCRCCFFFHFISANTKMKEKWTYYHITEMKCRLNGIASILFLCAFSHLHFVLFLNRFGEEKQAVAFFAFGILLLSSWLCLDRETLRLHYIAIHFFGFHFEPFFLSSCKRLAIHLALARQLSLGVCSFISFELHTA